MFFNCLLFQIGKFSNWHTFVNSREGRVVKIFINGRRMRTTSPLIIRDGKACFARTSSGHRFKFLDSELQRWLIWVFLFWKQFPELKYQYKLKVLKLFEKVQRVLHAPCPDTNLNSLTLNFKGSWIDFLL